MMREESKTYFQAASQGLGAEYLVGKAIGNKTIPDKDFVDAKDVQMVMTLAKHVATLTRTQREELANVLEKTTEAAKRHHEIQLSQSKPNTGIIPVPTTKQVLRHMICEGKSAVVTNLPHPNIEELGDHAYMLPSECIADLMAHGKINERSGRTIHEVQTLGKSKVAAKILMNNQKYNCLTIFLSLWSNDFEPDYCKGNRGSVWILTMTIETEKTQTPMVTNVYPIAVGPKGKSHQNVLCIVLQDIKALRT